MSDLRILIADSVWYGLPDSAAEIVTMTDMLSVADRLIRELGNLRLQPHGCGSDGCHRHRIISDWQGSDDWTADE